MKNNKVRDFFGTEIKVSDFLLVPDSDQLTLRQVLDLDGNYARFCVIGSSYVTPTYASSYQFRSFKSVVVNDYSLSSVQRLQTSRLTFDFLTIKTPDHGNDFLNQSIAIGDWACFSTNGSPLLGVSEIIDINIQFNYVYLRIGDIVYIRPPCKIVKLNPSPKLTAYLIKNL